MGVVSLRTVAEGGPWRRSPTNTSKFGVMDIFQLATIRTAPHKEAWYVRMSGLAASLKMGRKGVFAASSLILMRSKSESWIYQIHVSVTEGLEIVTSQKIALGWNQLDIFVSWDMYLRPTYERFVE